MPEETDMLPHAAFAAPADADLTIRRARSDDAPRLRDLARLDSARPLDGEVLVAEQEGRPVAALEVGSGRAVADPFRPTAGALGLLRVRAEQLRARSRRSVARRRRRAAGGPALSRG